MWQHRLTFRSPRDRHPVDEKYDAAVAKSGRAVDASVGVTGHTHHAVLHLNVQPEEVIDISDDHGPMPGKQAWVMDTWSPASLHQNLPKMFCPSGIGAWRKAVLTSAQMTLRPLAAASAVSTTVRAAVGRHADGARTSLFDAPPQTLPSCQYQLALVLLSSEARRLRCLRLVPRHAACDAEPPEVVHWWMKPHRLESSKVVGHSGRMLNCKQPEINWKLCVKEH